MLEVLVGVKASDHNCVGRLHPEQHCKLKSSADVEETATGNGSDEQPPRNNVNNVNNVNA